jgi:hypothetical protein
LIILEGTGKLPSAGRRLGDGFEVRKGGKLLVLVIVSRLASYAAPTP